MSQTVCLPVKNGTQTMSPLRESFPHFVTGAPQNLAVCQITGHAGANESESEVTWDTNRYQQNL